MPSRWLRNVTVTYELLPAIGQYTDIGDLHTADNEILRECLILLFAPHVANMLSALARIAISRHLGINRALCNGTCECDTIGFITLLDKLVLKYIACGIHGRAESFYQTAYMFAPRRDNKTPF